MTGTVTRVIDGKRILVRLDNSLQGSIEAPDFSDDPHAIDIASHLLQNGDTVTCRVLEMDQTNCRVRLTSRQSLLDDATSLRRDSESRDFQESFDENGSFRPLDPYYQTHPEAWEEAIRNSRSEQLRAEQEFRQLENRPIFSPFYFRGSQSEAIAQLESKPVGSCLFRPSPRGIDQIILTFKVRIL